MPKADSSNIAHAAITDHRVRRRPGTEARPPGRPTIAVPFVAYPPGPHAPSEAERDRDWAIAAGRLAGADPSARELGRPATEALTTALGRWPRDWEAWDALASLRGAAGDGPGAVEAARAAVDAAPASEAALSRLAFEATQAGELDAALRAADRLVEMSPTAVSHRVTRAAVHLRRRDWAKAEADAQAALAIQPLYWKARLYQAVCRHHRGDPAGARTEAAVAFELIPSESIKTAYRRWFREQTW
jgi:tetratricopeptide (TPR) repeat protein